MRQLSHTLIGRAVGAGVVLNEDTVADRVAETVWAEVAIVASGILIFDETALEFVAPVEAAQKRILARRIVGIVDTA